LVFTRNFAINQIVYAGNAIGDLKISSGWSSERNGLALRATLGRGDNPPSVVSGFVLPEQDSLSIRANIKDIELQWLQEMMNGTLYGLAGSVGANITVSGKMKDPAITGKVNFNNAAVGVTLLNTLYSINDSIAFNAHSIDFNRFTILDENRHTLTANGKITHDRFAGFNPNINLSVSDFMVLNNEQETDSLFYGSLRINGLLSVKKSAKDWLITGDITHSNDSKITVNIPSSASTAEHYNSITYINTKEPENEKLRTKDKKEDKKLSLPLKLNASFWFDPSLNIGAVFNPATGDMAHVTGNGMVKLSYDMNTSAMSFLGDYEVESGNASLSLVGLKKTFTVQRGGKLVFHGDPMATTFDLTALYNLRANLSALDPNFSTVLVNPKVPVSCSVTATGSMDKMTLKYNILLPNETDDIQRKMDGLLYTDAMKIKEIAYLLTFGTFLPATSNTSSAGSPDLLNSSLAALAGGGLNKLLAGVLNDNWSVDTDLQPGSNGDDMGMDVNVSTRLFDDRLTINGTVGYRNNAKQTNNFTGDFDVEYKLIPSGNLLLKVYNATNNQYYDSQATTTQGVGLVYKRQARTFKNLFDKFKKKK
jgi:hypothetical protein